MFNNDDSVCNNCIVKVNCNTCCDNKFDEVKLKIDSINHIQYTQEIIPLQIYNNLTLNLNQSINTDLKDIKKEQLKYIFKKMIVDDKCIFCNRENFINIHGSYSTSNNDPLLEEYQQEIHSKLICEFCKTLFYIKYNNKEGINLYSVESGIHIILNINRHKPVRFCSIVQSIFLELNKSQFYELISTTKTSKYGI